MIKCHGQGSRAQKQRRVCFLRKVETPQNGMFGLFPFKHQPQELSSLYRNPTAGAKATQAPRTEEMALEEVQHDFLVYAPRLSFVCENTGKHE